MSTNPAAFHTQVASQATIKAAGGQAALAGTGKGIFSAPGLNFLDLLLGQITAPEGETATNADTAPLETVLNLETTSDPLEGLALEDAGLENIDFGNIDSGNTSIENIGTEHIGTGNTNTAEHEAIEPKKRKDLMAWLQSMLEGIPVESRSVTLPNGTGKGLQTGTDAGDAAPALIATGLSPEELTAFLEELKQRTAEGESFLVGLVKILPPQAKREMIFHPRALLVTAPNQNSLAEEDDLAAKLNALVPGASDEGTEDSRKTGFDRVLQVLEQAQQRKADAGQPIPPGLEKAINNAKAHSAGLSTVQGPTLPDGMNFASGQSGDVFPEGMDWNAAQGAQAQMSLNGPAVMTSLVSNAPHATHAHPATHTVAATISKAISEGGDKNITVKLNPPELGRVEIRMEFSEEKTAKVHLLAEKQETFLMLQRDSHVLQRALEEAGLDAGGSELSFELAQDGSLFDHGSHRDGGQNAAGGGDAGAAGDGDIEIIEASVDWYIDPETGLTRYDILA